MLLYRIAQQGAKGTSPFGPCAHGPCFPVRNSKEALHEKATNCLTLRAPRTYNRLRRLCRRYSVVSEAFATSREREPLTSDLAEDASGVDGAGAGPLRGRRAQVALARRLSEK